MVECIRVKWSPVEVNRAVVECSRESSRAVVECSRVKYSQVEPWWSVVESSTVK